MQAAFEKGHQNTHARDGSPPTGGGALFHALENLLKGIEIDLPADLPFTDKGGLSRTSARTKWWLGEGATLDKGLFFPEEFEHLLPVEHLPSTVVPGHDGGSPLFVGHYWLTGTPEALSEMVACVDYSVANGGPLVAYRWDGEQVLTSRNFVKSN